MSIFQASCSFLAATPSTPSLVSPILRHFDSEGSKTRPWALFTPAHIVAKLEQAYPVMTQGRFSDAIGLFRDILQQAVVTVAANYQESAEVLLLSFF